MKYGVTFICILYGFCAIRMLIPIEVPVFQKVICDPHLYSHLMRLYFGPTTQIISKEDVENGFYDLYPIINEK